MTPAYEEYYHNGIPAGTAAPGEAGWRLPALFQVPRASAGCCWPRRRSTARTAARGCSRPRRRASTACAFRKPAKATAWATSARSRRCRGGRPGA